MDLIRRIRGMALYVCLLSLNQTLHAAYDVQAWFNVTAIGALSVEQPKMRYWLEGQERVGDDVSRNFQNIVRPGIGYAISEHTSLWLGYAYIYTEQLGSRLIVKENRIWQQMLWRTAYNSMALTHRLRLEQRFFQPNTNTAWRLRDMVKVGLPFYSKAKLSLVSSNEIFFHLNNFNGIENQGFDQNRYFIGLAYGFNPSSTLEMGYMNQYIRRINTTNLSCDNITMQLSLNF